MSLAFGHPVIAIPGPTPVPHRVLRAMNRASPDIYGDELAELNLQVMANLKRLAGTGASLAPYIGNGHTGWEAAAANLFNPGDAALLLASGHFGRSWAEQMTQMGVAVEVLDFDNAPPSADRLAERLEKDKAHKIRTVMVCQTDTASSAATDIPALKQAIGDHPALLVVDAIASLGCAPMFMDEWGVDVLIAASQKGLMCPPGCAFVWFSDRALARGRTALTTPVWDWHKRANAPALWAFWGGTPPVQMLFGLHESLQIILDEEGLKAVWSRHAALAAAVWAAADRWAEGNSSIRLTVTDPAMRSSAVTAMSLPRADALRGWLTTKAGVTLGVGLGAKNPENALRVAHMGHTNAATIMAVLGSMEAGMIALSIPHGKGGVEAAARVIAARA